MKNCPECDSDLITVESSREMRFSRIICDDCDFEITGEINEDALIKKWDRLKRD
jgi:transposase-like protein